MVSSQVSAAAHGAVSLLKGSCPEGSADDVLAIALAALVYNKRCGGEDDHGLWLEDLMVAVETASTSYVAGGVWRTPPAWRGKDQCRKQKQKLINPRTLCHKTS